MSEPEVKSSLHKTTIIYLFVLFTAIVITATVTYSLTSKQFLDNQDDQNKQIDLLQNALRKANGLPEQSETN